MTARLATLLAPLADAEVAGGDPVQVEVASVTQDSAAVGEGSLFCCIVGSKVDAHDLAPGAVARGAGSLLVERWLEVGVPQVRVPSTRRAVGPVAAAFFGNPSDDLDVIGVTGTNGKTTTTHLLAAILRHAGRPTAVIGTLSGARTTPEAPVLQSTLAQARADGCAAVTMEVSSMALDQNRVDGTTFAAAVWTNLSQDHLDYHGDMEHYFAAKALLFRPGRARLAVVNRDDEWGRRLLDAVPGAVTYGLDDVCGVVAGAGRTTFRWRGIDVDLPLGGTHNVANALAAAATAAALGIPTDVIADGLHHIPPVPGRWEVIDSGQPFGVVIDYAHTPDGLERALVAARASVDTGARVLLVFGCGGDRDRAKRPRMGEVASRLADLAILTTDNPRTEDPMAIIAQTAAGAAEPGRLVVEPDREAAIGAALDAARPGDLVLVAGKGHETGQIVGDAVIPFDDREVARRHLASMV